MLEKFKAFAMKGNVIDLAVGVIIGAAFGKIVSSFVSDILMPPLGVLIGKVDFSELYINLTSTHYATLAEAKKAGAATLNYGMFLNQVIDFLIVAFSIFIFVQMISKLERHKATAAATMQDCPFCLMAIPIASKKCGHCTSSLTA
jgi:large conductance mechanosensitive channel